MTKDERRAIYHEVFNSATGKEVLKDLAKVCSFEHTSFDSDPLKMANKEGKKDLLRHIQKQLEAK